jgi:hypothetical protein
MRKFAIILHGVAVKQEQYKGITEEIKGDWGYQ